MFLPAAVFGTTTHKIINAFLTRNGNCPGTLSGVPENPGRPTYGSRVSWEMQLADRFVWRACSRDFFGTCILVEMILCALAQLGSFIGRPVHIRNRELHTAIQSKLTNAGITPLPETQHAIKMPLYSVTVSDPVLLE
ncbi:uncharacterized protein ARMOST_14374 [Armillaria ostoyae]|uniref:Uncharacterized protein n=1 Tax=Armillaria ostoyae TaxID=47428 RepID=A0A284RQG9_ARMOS|nr:uncharacterized protein ARMOST_14374 [Armillaria ostoyae]